jgi:hypothetical protein
MTQPSKECSQNMAASVSEAEVAAQPWEVYDSVLERLSSSISKEAAGLSAKGPPLPPTQSSIAAAREVIRARVDIYRNRFTVVRKVEARLGRRMTDCEKNYLQKLLFERAQQEVQKGIS